MSDFIIPLVLSAPLDNPVVAAIQQVFIKAQEICPWLPNLSGESADLLYNDPPQFPRLNPNPSGLTTNQQKQWSMIWKAMQPIASNVVKGEQQRAQDDSRNLAANTSFWDSVYRIDLAVATVGLSEVAPIVEEKWAELKDRMSEWKETRAWAVRIANDPRCPADKSAQVMAKLAELDGTISGKITSMIAQIPEFSGPVRQEGLGAIAVLSALATVKTAVLITAIVAVVAVLVYCISSVKQVIEDLGLSAIGEALKSAQKFLGPFLGVAILGLIGYVAYRKLAGPKTVRIATS